MEEMTLRSALTVIITSAVIGLAKWVQTVWQKKTGRHLDSKDLKKRIDDMTTKLSEHDSSIKLIRQEQSNYKELRMAEGEHFKIFSQDLKDQVNGVQAQCNKIMEILVHISSGYKK